MGGKGEASGVRPSRDVKAMGGADLLALGADNAEKCLSLAQRTSGEAGQPIEIGIVFGFQHRKRRERSAAVFAFDGLPDRSRQRPDGSCHHKSMLLCAPNTRQNALPPAWFRIIFRILPWG